MRDDIVDRSVEDGDIDDNLRTEEIWERIRDDYIAEATVVIVLIGRDTWSRKYVDWELGSALNKSRNNSRCGVLGIVLPDHPDYGKEPIDTNLIPPRLVANIEGDNPYVRLYHWPRDGPLSIVRDWVHTAFLRRNGPRPDNFSKRFKNNRDPYSCAPKQTGLTLGKGIVIVGVAAVGIYLACKYASSQRIDPMHDFRFLPSTAPNRHRRSRY